MWEKLEQINKRYEELVAQMSNQEIATDHVQMTKLAQEKSSLDGIIALYQDYKATVKSLEDTRAMMNEKLDTEMLAMVKEEAHHLEEKQTRLQEELRLALLPKDPNDERNVFLEVRAGTGGDEAALFSGDLFRMYTRFAERNRWQVEIISESPGEKGGFKEIIARIIGQGAYSVLKFESGAHRVHERRQEVQEGRRGSTGCFAFRLGRHRLDQEGHVAPALAHVH